MLFNARTTAPAAAAVTFDALERLVVPEATTLPAGPNRSCPSRYMQRANPFPR